MKKCVECGSSSLKHTVEVVPFNGVATVEADIYTCLSCGERYEGFSRVEELTREIAQNIARRVERLRDGTAKTVSARDALSMARAAVAARRA